MKTAHSDKMAAADVLGLRRTARRESEGARPEIVIRPEQLVPTGKFAGLKPYLPGILLALAIVLIPWAVYFLNHS
jgi:hypothetical protein